MSPKRILFVSPSSNPFEIKYGGAQRTNLLLKACCEMGDVDIVCFDKISSKIKENGFKIIYQQDIPCGTSPDTRLHKFFKLFLSCDFERHWNVVKEREKVVDSLVQAKNYDYVVTRYVDEAVTAGLLKYANKLVVDVDDNPVKEAQNAAVLAKTIRNRVYMTIYATMTRLALHRFVRQVAVTFFSNQKEATTYHSHYLPNIPFYDVPLERLNRSHIVHRRLLFIGDLTFGPNIHGLNRFLDNIYPNITGCNEIHIVGRIYDKNLQEKWQSIPGVHVMGFVDDIVREYAEAEIVVIPIYYGSGTCIKVLEAMQMQRIVVTTNIGIRGYENFLTPQKDYLLADSNTSFADIISSTLGNEKLQIDITKHAYNIIENHFSRDTFNGIVRTALS